MINKEQKKHYLFWVAMTFIAALLVYVLVFQSAGEHENVGIKYVGVLIFYGLILSFIYGIIKLIFHSQAKSPKDEIVLEELPEDQDDTAKRH